MFSYMSPADPAPCPLSAPPHPRKGIYELNRDVGKSLDDLDLKVRDCNDLFPLSTIVREGFDPLHRDIGEGIDDLDFDVREGCDNLDLAVEDDPAERTT